MRLIGRAATSTRAQFPTKRGLQGPGAKNRNEPAIAPLLAAENSKIATVPSISCRALIKEVDLTNSSLGETTSPRE